MADVVHQSEQEEARPIAELLRLAGPTVAQMTSFTLMQFLDMWMLAHVGDRLTAPTAGANSGILAFSVISLGMGILWVVNTLVSQSFGRKDFAACGQFMWQGVWFSVFLAAAVMPLLPLAPRFFLALGHEPPLAAAEAIYLQIVVAWSVFKLVQTAIAQFLLAIDRAVYVMTATIIAVAVNALAAWVLIFGHWGFREGGVVGAAWAQNIGVLVEMVLCAAFALQPSIRGKFHALDWKLRAEKLWTLLRVGVPSGVQVVADVLAWSAYINLVMGAFGTRAMAANNFVFRYMSVSFMPAFGISTAVTALVGRYIGRGRPDIALARGHLGFKIAAVYMLICGGLFFLFRNQLIGLFTTDAEVIRTGAMMLVFAAVYQLFDAMYIVYYGGLRGAGDTLVPAIATALLCWSITVFGGYMVAVHAHRFGPKGPWFLATAYGAILGVFMYMRFARGKWRSINLERHADSDKVHGFEVLPNEQVTGQQLTAES